MHSHPMWVHQPSCIQMTQYRCYLIKKSHAIPAKENLFQSPALAMIFIDMPWHSAVISPRFLQVDKRWQVFNHRGCSWVTYCILPLKVQLTWSKFGSIYLIFYTALSRRWGLSNNQSIPIINFMLYLIRFCVQIFFRRTPAFSAQSCVKYQMSGPKFDEVSWNLTQQIL